ncbi:hypothetical protein [Geodermatophilus sp. DF01-2]|uniref:hypothetical protein n=1 Tax=Geodermatophilus sp. DF01-2 TaxID=2559610 RepID=UPI001FD8613F|nr:hypothetical protein [Geodermatophilus sp. DF01_2]
MSEAVTWASRALLRSILASHQSVRVGKVVGEGGAAAAGGFGGVAVPHVAVDEDGDLLAAVDQVGAADQVAGVQPVAGAVGVQHVAQRGLLP